MAETPAQQPQPGIDYPRNLIEFEEFFPDEQACLAYLERLRWAGGFVCPAGHVAAAAWRSARGLHICPIRLDGPSVRMLYVNLDEAMTEESDSGDEVIRISGIQCPEFLEPTKVDRGC